VGKFHSLAAALAAAGVEAVPVAAGAAVVPAAGGPSPAQLDLLGVYFDPGAGGGHSAGALVR
jgi:hypothetical protein